MGKIYFLEDPGHHMEIEEIITDDATIEEKGYETLIDILSDRGFAYLGKKDLLGFEPEKDFPLPSRFTQVYEKDDMFFALCSDYSSFNVCSLIKAYDFEGLKKEYRCYYNSELEFFLEMDADARKLRKKNK